MKRKLWFIPIAVLIIAIALIVPSMVFAEGPVYPDMEGIYSCKGTVYQIKIDGTQLAKERISMLTIVSQTDSVIDEATLTIGDPQAPTISLDLAGYVGSGTRPRLALYAIGDVAPGEGGPELDGGDLAIIDCRVSLDKQGAVKSIKGSIEGLNNAATPYQYFGKLSGKWATPN